MIELFFILMSLRIFSLLTEVFFDVPFNDNAFFMCQVLRFLRSRVKYIRICLQMKKEVVNSLVSQKSLR